MSLGKFVLVLLYFYGVLSVTLVVTFSVDIYVLVQLIYAGSVSLASIIGLYAVSLLSMYLGISLFVFFDRAYSSKVVKINIFHSILYTLVIVFILSLHAHVQRSFTQNTLALAALPIEENLDMVWQMTIARIVLFALGSPFITYFTCTIPARYTLKGLILRGK